MKITTILLLFCITSHLEAQRIQPITIDELNERTHNGPDTTYIINFWATWCKPCVKELPNFLSFDSAYIGGKVKVLLVSVDFSTEVNRKLIPFIKKLNFKKETYIIADKNQQEYIVKVDTAWSGAIPATLFIKGNKRKLVEQSLTYDELLQYYKNIQ